MKKGRRKDSTAERIEKNIEKMHEWSEVLPRAK